jgi:putative hemolysin
MLTTLLELLAALVLFLVGLRLSAFFSGSETGFYRLSPLRLAIDADGGDPIALRLTWFARRPSWFVATTLVGNNVANYATTLAIGLATVIFVGTGSGWIEIVATLLVAPVVFVFGELIPKNLHYRAPMSLLRKSIGAFTWFYRLFLPVSLPLVGLARLFEWLSGSKDRIDVLGRNRLVQALSQGHEHGLLTDVQNRLAHGVLGAGTRSVREVMTPVARALGVPHDTDRASVLAYAGRLGLNHVLVHDAAGRWTGYLRVIDVSVSRRRVASLIRPLPRIAADSSTLDALIALRQAGEVRGVVVKGDTVVGILSEQGLIERLFRATNVWQPEPPAE